MADWDKSKTRDVLVAARMEVLRASKGIEFRMEQIDPTWESRNELYDGEPDYDLQISEIGTLWTLSQMLARANSALWELERRMDAQGVPAAVPAEG